MIPPSKEILKKRQNIPDALHGHLIKSWLNGWDSDHIDTVSQLL